MKQNEIYKKSDEVYRIISVGKDKIFIINCIKRFMPFWAESSFLEGYELISENELINLSGLNIRNYDDLSQSQKKEIQTKFGSISVILPYVSLEYERNKLIKWSCEKYKISKGTIKTRLCLYLAFQDICVLLGNTVKAKKELSKDEKNFRWALNKFYYNSLKLPLVESYRRMIKERYCDSNGKILDKIPTINQYSYFFRKTVNKENLIISREGKGEFLRNHRVMLGNGIRDFCPTIGYGMMDSTVCDIFLVNEKGELLGRPIMTACVDGYSAMCLGYSLGFEGGINSLNSLVKNICTDKVEWCKKFGIEIKKEDWDCSRLPHKFITDKGREYVSETFSQITELGIEIINLEPYRPELKGVVEKFFDIIQSAYKKELANKGVIFEDYQERGGIDYRKKATLTLREFEKIVLYCIIRYNSKRVINLPYELVGKVEPFSNELWNYCKTKNSDTLIKADKELLRLTLLPRCKGVFKRNGLMVNKIRYKCDKNFTDKYLKGGDCVVAYDPKDVSRVYVKLSDTYETARVIETFFNELSIEEVNTVMEKKKEVEKNSRDKEIQGQLDLSNSIEDVIRTISSPKVEIKEVRKHRQNEINKGKV